MFFFDTGSTVISVEYSRLAGLQTSVNPNSGLQVCVANAESTPLPLHVFGFLFVYFDERLVIRL